MEAAQTGSAIRDVTTAVGISISVNLSNNHAITMQTHVAADATSKNAVVDELTGIADRLIAKYSLEALRKQLSLLTDQLKNLIGNVARIDAAHRNAYEKAGKRKPFELSAKQEMERNNALETEKRFREQIIALRSEIRETETRAGVPSSDLPETPPVQNFQTPQEKGD